MDDSRLDQPESEVLPPQTARAVTLEELYVSNPHPAENSWVSSIATVILALAAAAALLEVVGYW